MELVCFVYQYMYKPNMCIHSVSKSDIIAYPKLIKALTLKCKQMLMEIIRTCL